MIFIGEPIPPPPLTVKLVGGSRETSAILSVLLCYNDVATHIYDRYRGAHTTPLKLN